MKKYNSVFQTVVHGRPPGGPWYYILHIVLYDIMQSFKLNKNGKNDCLENFFKSVNRKSALWKI
jgi:hypothetical protein